MKSYIGAKIIVAEPMSKQEFDFRKNNLLQQDMEQDVDLPEFQACDHGYLVGYSNPDGSIYYAWSPKDVFERAYREISDDEKELILTK